MKRFFFFKSTIEKLNKLKDEFLSYLTGKLKSDKSLSKTKFNKKSASSTKTANFPGVNENIYDLPKETIEEQIVIKMHLDYIAPTKGVLKVKDLFTTFCTKDIIKGI